MSKSPLEKLMDTNSGLEIWWDSSPLIYSAWSEEFLKKIPEEKKEEVKEQLTRFYDINNPGKTLFRGVTTNPPLSLQVIKKREPYVAQIADELIDKNQGIDKESLFWLTYKEIVKQGSDMYLEAFKQSNHKYGYLSGQVDPRSVFDKDKMLSQALDLVSLNPNVMIKVPGSKEGYEVIRELTARGIATNNTLTFTLPQLMKCAKTVKEGLETAKQNNVDLTRWRSVITHMDARYGELGDLKKEAGSLGIELSEADTRLAEIAISKKAYKLLKEGNYPSKLLICSMRISPTVNGKKECWHLEKLAGGSVVFTCPPSFIEGTYESLNNTEFTQQIEEEIPKEILDKLLKIPYFEKAYREDGYTAEEFNTHTALMATATEFSKATEEMVSFVAKRLEAKQLK